MCCNTCTLVLLISDGHFLSHTGYCSTRHSNRLDWQRHSESQDAIWLPMTPKGHSHKKSNRHKLGHTFSHNIVSSWIVVPTQAIGKHSPLKFSSSYDVYHCVSQPDVASVSRSCVLQLLICKEILLLGSLLQNGWHHDPGDFVLFITIVVPTGFTVQCTIHICVPFLDHYVDYRDCRWYLKDVNVSWQVCCFIFLKKCMSLVLLFPSRDPSKLYI